MAALTQDRDSAEHGGKELVYGVSSAKIIYKGALLVHAADGYVEPGTTATTLVAAGRAEEYVDNSAGADGAKTVKVRKGVFKFNNSSAGDLITIAEIGDDCYIVDDQTVAKTNGTSTRSVAGKIVAVESDGVFVRIA